VSGLPIENSSHAEEIVKAALEIQNFMNKLPVGNPPACLPDRRAGRAGVQLANGNSNLQTANWQLRIGIHSGPLTAGVVGDKKFAYDIWGDTVNTANRMESSCEPNKVNISGEIYRLLQNSEFKIQHLKFQYRGKIPAKNKGEIEMYFVEEK
jgi:class 3 adenylate cyclase